jgi:hypothetical protein
MQGQASGYLSFYSTTGNDTAVTLGSDETADYRIEIRTNSTQKEFGHGAYIAIDTEDSSNTADVDEDTVEVIVNGQVLTDISSTLPGNDVSALSTSELIYKVEPGIIRQQTTTIDLEFTPESGTNPDFDVLVRFVPLGNYQDDDNPNEILTGVGFRTDSSRTAILDTTINAIKLQID